MNTRNWVVGVVVLWGGVALAGKKQQLPTVTEQTYLGPISCTVTMAKVVPPKPILTTNSATPVATPADPSAPQAAGAAGTNALPGLPQLPQPEGLDAQQAANGPQPGNPATPAGQNPVVNGLQQPAVGGAGMQANQAPNGAPQNPALTPPPKKILNYQDCLSNGGTVVIMPDGQAKGLVIDNPEILKGYEWKRVSLSGYMKGVVFHVVSIREI